MNIDYSDLLYQILSLLVAAVAAFVVPYIRKWLLAKISAEQLVTAVHVAKVAVKAVEQTQLMIRGKAKLSAALQVAKSYAKRLGINLTDEQWRALLEQAVQEMNQASRPRPPAA